MTESDPTVLLVAWSGPTSALAARLGLAPDTLLSRLRRLPGGTHHSLIKVEVVLTNPGPIIGALRRKLDPQTMNETVY